MNKPRRQMDAFDLNEEGEADYNKGFCAYVDGIPLAEGNGTVSWRQGWLDAQADPKAQNRMVEESI